MINSTVDIEVKGTCIAKNGEYAVGRMVCSLNGARADIGFVSERLRRTLKAGASIDADDLDRFCIAWLEMRRHAGHAGHALNDERDDRDDRDDREDEGGLKEANQWWCCRSPYGQHDPMCPNARIEHGITLARKESSNHE